MTSTYANLTATMIDESGENHAAATLTSMTSDMTPSYFIYYYNPEQQNAAINFEQQQQNLQQIADNNNIAGNYYYYTIDEPSTYVQNNNDYFIQPTYVECNNELYNNIINNNNLAVNEYWSR